MVSAEGPEIEPVWQDVLARILRHVSVDYYYVEDCAGTTVTDARVLTAVRWTPHEISLVPTPADPSADTRMEAEMTQNSNLVREENEVQNRVCVEADNAGQTRTSNVPARNTAKTRAVANAKSAPSPASPGWTCPGLMARLPQAPIPIPPPAPPSRRWRTCSHP